jgi:lipid II:glycine glycyltransferase (peptidoglycan interpeptide bridge formation enzyme)
MLELRDLRPDWESSWASLIAAQQDATLFHQADWLRVLQRTQHLEFVPLGIVNEGRVVGVLPLFVKSYGLFKIAASPFEVTDTPYLGPVMNTPCWSQLLQAVSAWARRHHTGFVRLLLPPEPSRALSLQPSVERRVRLSPIAKSTHILDLTQGVAPIWKGFRDGCRTAVKKAQRAGLEVSFGRDLGQIDGYYQLADALFRAQGRRHPNSKEFFDELWQRFSPSGNVSLVLASLGSQLLGGVFLGHFRETVYYLDGASNPEGKRLQAANLLLWESIRWASECGYRAFDFVGSDIPRLARFKEGFGGKLHSYWCVEISFGRVARLLRKAYPRWKTVVARLRP